MAEFLFWGVVAICMWGAISYDDELRYRDRMQAGEANRKRILQAVKKYIKEK